MDGDGNEIMFGRFALSTEAEGISCENNQSMHGSFLTYLLTVKESVLRAIKVCMEDLAYL